MTKGRLEAFSDGVIAIIITIMVLELRPPKGARFENLEPLVPTFLSYLLSFALLGTWWNNHHHLLQAARVIDARVLWANLHLLFWLSLLLSARHGSVRPPSRRYRWRPTRDCSAGQGWRTTSWSAR